MADLPRSPHRGALRSWTYIGIAAAMALQLAVGMPTLLGYCKIRTEDRGPIQYHINHGLALLRGTGACKCMRPGSHSA
eukprot:scaffold2107_cov127-Isochrysis_galbana.AAC.8